MVVGCLIHRNDKTRYICPFATPCVIAFTPAPLEDDVRPINCKYIELPSPVTLIKLSLKVDATIISGCDPQIMCASYISGKYRL